MDTDLRVYRRGSQGPESLAALFAPWATVERWLFVSPHDDDVLIGAGLWLQALIGTGADVSVAIVTDGRMGYTNPTDRDTIVARRRQEAERAYAAIGVYASAIHFLGFPDGELARHSGSRLEDGQPAGLACALTRLLRELKPTRVVTTDASDWHPDHQATFEGVRMSLFHACGAIWSELGPPLPSVPALYAFTVYAPLDAAPDFMVEGSGTAVARRRDALGEFASQADIVSRIPGGARQEYLRRVDTRLHDGGSYRHMFAG